MTLRAVGLCEQDEQPVNVTMMVRRRRLLTISAASQRGTVEGGRHHQHERRHQRQQSRAPARVTTSATLRLTIPDNQKQDQAEKGTHIVDDERPVGDTGRCRNFSSERASERCSSVIKRSWRRRKRDDETVQTSMRTAGDAFLVCDVATK